MVHRGNQHSRKWKKKAKEKQMTGSQRNASPDRAPSQEYRGIRYPQPERQRNDSEQFLPPSALQPTRHAMVSGESSTLYYDQSSCPPDVKEKPNRAKPHRDHPYGSHYEKNPRASQPVDENFSHSSRKHCSNATRGAPCMAPSRLQGENCENHRQELARRSSSNSETSGPAIALVGNPGAGKSTILNGIAGQVAFKAGISLGSGLTTVLQQHAGNGLTLYDTPGLADVERKKTAGLELDKLLAEHVPIKIAFVVTLERGRVRPEDALTIDLVLEAIRYDTNDRFGVIINQMTDRVFDQMNLSEEKEAIVRKSIVGKHSTSHWCYVRLEDELEDATDGMLMTQELYSFFLSLPETKSRDARTVPIDTDDMQEKLEKHLQLIRDIEATNAIERKHLTEELRDQKKKYVAQEARLLQLEQNLQQEVLMAQAKAAQAKAAADEAAAQASKAGRQWHHENALPHRPPTNGNGELAANGMEQRPSSQRKPPLGPMLLPVVAAPVVAEGLRIAHDAAFDKGSGEAPATQPTRRNGEMPQDGQMPGAQLDSGAIQTPSEPTASNDVNSKVPDYVDTQPGVPFVDAQQNIGYGAYDYQDWSLGYWG